MSKFFLDHLNPLTALFLVATVGLIGAKQPLHAQALGPDLIASEVAGAASYWGSVTNKAAYSLARGACNLGSEPVAWDATGAHPVSSTNLFLYNGQRFQQIGMSWARHAFCALNSAACGTCIPGNCSSLGIGCSTVNSSFSSGAISGYAARSDINAWDGSFIWPATQPSAISSVLAGRLQVEESMLASGTFPIANYFAELQYIASDDLAAGNGMNNVSWREVTVSPNLNLLPSGPSILEEPAILAWQLLDPEVQIQIVDIPGEGRLYLGARAYDLGSGVWRYEYALYNMNSHQSVRAVEWADVLGISDEDFKDIDHHSGELYSTADWSIQSGTSLRYESESFAVDPNANALRWGCLFNFGFSSTAAPSSGEITIELFRPGILNELTVTVLRPDPLAASFIRGDINGDSSVNIADAVLSLNTIFALGAPLQACSDAADANDDGQFNIADAVYTLNALFVLGSPGFPDPSSSCGEDPTADLLDCFSYDGCL